MTDEEKKLPRPRRLTSEEGENPPTLLLLAAGFAIAILMGGCCLCAGAAWWFRPQIIEDPVRASESLTEIADITIPESFLPHGLIDWNIAFALHIRGVYYERFIGDGMLMLVEVKSRFRADGDVRRHIRKTLIEKGGGGAPLIVDDAETRIVELQINGELVPFTFEIGRDPPSGHVYRMVEGVFPGKSGEVLFALRVDDEHWDQESIMKMLKSIGTPQLTLPPETPAPETPPPITPP